MLNKVALVTGGTRGIGKAISIALKQAGCEVIAVYKNSSSLDYSYGIHTMQLDVSSFEDCTKCVADIHERFGSIDILINNAGITKDGMFHKMSYDNWFEVINTNLNSCYNMTRNVITEMRNRKFGRIINISSVNGCKGQMGQVNYSAAKAGVIGFTKALALETAKSGITVNAIAPGYIETDMVKAISNNVLEKIIEQIPVNRLGMVEEIADAVLYLINAAFITGSTMHINGGQYCV